MLREKKYARNYYSRYATFEKIVSRNRQPCRGPNTTSDREASRSIDCCWLIGASYWCYQYRSRRQHLRCRCFRLARRSEIGIYEE